MSRSAHSKIANMRVFTLTALSLMCGIGYAFFVAYSGFGQVALLFPVAAVCCAFIVVVLIAGLKRAARLIAVAALFFCIGECSAYFAYVGYCTSEVPLGQLDTLFGRVEEVGTSYSGRGYLVLGNATFGGTPLGGKVIVYLTDTAGDYCRAGYTVELLTTLGKEEFFSEGEIGYRAVSGIKYYCTVYGGMDATQDFVLTAAIRNAVYDALFLNLDGNTAAVVYAMLTGDSSGIADGTISAFRYGGIAHIFAVSGLHIGVIYGAVTLLLKRVNRFVSVPVSIAFIFFYSAVCSFTPSSVRAAVMCSVSAAMSLFHRRYDSLNAMSLAATVLLLINPMYLLDKGFILSFSAVSGIIFLKYPLQRLLGFLPRRMASSLSVSLSAQVGSFAGLMSGFGYVSAVGILLNVLVLPVLSAFYIVIFASTAVTLALPQAGAVLAAVCTPLEAFINAMTALGFESALLKDWNSALTYAASIFLFIGLTDKLNLSSAIRYISAAVAAALAVAAAVAAYVSLGGTRITVATGYSGGIITLSSPEGDVVFLTQSYYGRTDIPSDVSAAVLVGDGGDLSAYFNLGESVPCLYVPEGAPFTGVISGTEIVSSSHFTLCGAEITLTDSSVIISAEGVSVCMTVCEGEYDLTALPGGADIAVFASEEKQAIALTSDGGDYALSYSGALTFALSDGQYSLLSSVPKG